MEVLVAIKGRRSVRRYSREPVAHELVERILEAAVWAPSAKNLQPWRFLVVEGQPKNRLAEILGHVAEQMMEHADPLERSYGYGTEESAKIIREAPVLITVWNTGPISKGETALLQDTTPSHLLAWSVEIQSAAAAIQNMLLVAYSMGLGGLWTCDLNHAAAQVREYLSIEGDLTAGVVIGYPAEVRPPPRRCSLVEVVTWVGGTGKGQFGSEETVT